VSTVVVTTFVIHITTRPKCLQRHWTQHYLETTVSTECLDYNETQVSSQALHTTSEI